MYDFLAGPMLWISASVGLSGLLFRTILIFRATHNGYTRGTSSPIAGVAGRASSLMTGLRTFFRGLSRSFLIRQTSFFLLTLLFHLCLIITPLFLTAHSVLFFQSWQISLPALPERGTDILTVIILACGMLLFLRRLLAPSVRALTSAQDIALLMLTLAPFVTGFIAYRQYFAYETFLRLHMITGHLVLMALGWTRLGHMALFFVARFFISGEHSLVGGSRLWYRHSLSGEELR